MNVKDTGLEALRKGFNKTLLNQIEDGLSSKEYKMKDVASFLGISSQVASKLVNPNIPRTMTAFELFRFSVFRRKPILDFVSPEMYMTPDELNNQVLCQKMAVASSPAEFETLSALYWKLPESGRKYLLDMAETLLKDIYS